MRHSIDLNRVINEGGILCINQESIVMRKLLPSIKDI